MQRKNGKNKRQLNQSKKSISLRQCTRKGTTTYFGLDVQKNAEKLYLKSKSNCTKRYIKNKLQKIKLTINSKYKTYNKNNNSAAMAVIYSPKYHFSSPVGTVRKSLSRSSLWTRAAEGGRDFDRLRMTKLPRGHSLDCFLERSSSLLSSTSLVSVLRETGHFTPGGARLADRFLFRLTLSAVLVRTALGNFLVQRVGGQGGRAGMRELYTMTASQSPSFASRTLVLKYRTHSSLAVNSRRANSNHFSSDLRASCSLSSFSAMKVGVSGSGALNLLMTATTEV